ncbi:integrase [Pseudomonas sp. F-14 TE3623]
MGTPIACNGIQLLNEERTFAYVAEQWLAFKSAELVTKSITGFRGALNNHILPAIGKKPVSEIKLEHITTIITALRRQRTMAMARRVCTIIRAILGFAEGRGWVERNVALSNIEELKIRHVVTSNPAIERPADLGRFLLRLDDCSNGSNGSVATVMRLLVMLPVRPGELVQMRWEDVDLVGADWRYVVSKTKHLDKSKHVFAGKAGTNVEIATSPQRTPTNYTQTKMPLISGVFVYLEGDGTLTNHRL